MAAREKREVIEALLKESGEAGYRTELWTLPDTVKADALLKDAHARRSVDVATAFQERNTGAEATGLKQQMEQAGLTISREGDQYILTNRAGAKAVFNSAEDAVAAVQAHVGAGEGRRRQ